jgi:hypothetical protein
MWQTWNPSSRLLHKSSMNSEASTWCCPTPASLADLAAAMLTNGYLTGHITLLDGGIHPR